MQQKDIISACSGGQVSVSIRTVNYYVAPADIVNSCICGVELPPCQDPGIIDAGASAFQHPGKKGIFIVILQGTRMVLKVTCKSLAPGSLKREYRRFPAVLFPGKNPGFGQITGILRIPGEGCYV